MYNNELVKVKDILSGIDLELAIMNTLGMTCIILIAVASKSVEAGVAISAVISLLKEYYKYKESKKVKRKKQNKSALSTYLPLGYEEVSIHKILSTFLIL